MPILKIDAVIFDMDGVITDTMPYHYRAWKKVYAGEGLLVEECEVYLREGQPGHRMIRQIFREHGKVFHEGLAKRMLEQKERIFKRIVRPVFVPGARAFLRHLRGKNIRTALVTGTARHEVHKILQGDFLDRFDAIVTGDEVKHGKPNPEPFLTALKKLKIRPDEAVVVENAPFGIFSAKKARLKCIALETYLDRAYLKDADYIVSSFRDLRKRLDFETLKTRGR
ncbi:MAG: HAD family phosphatase [Candidatus Omnitrophota bacterium]